MTQRCLIIADDLTGGADTGAQFANFGLKTFLISCEKDHSIDFSKSALQDALVINTDSRGLHPEEASHRITTLLKGYDSSLFPILYKKIDSTLRGNLGYEIDALMQEMNSPLCFMTPAYPEMGRTVVDGMLMIHGKPLAFTEMSHDASYPIRESSVCKLLELQSRRPIGWIGLDEMASGPEKLQKQLEGKGKGGSQVIIFDAADRKDLMTIVEVAFRMVKMPLLVGSAGLAQEAARKLSPLAVRCSHPSGKKRRPFSHIFIISGSASNVTRRQLSQVEAMNIPPFVVPSEWIVRDEPTSEIPRRDFSRKIARALSEGSAVLEAPLETIPRDLTTHASQFTITKTLASLALSALEELGVKTDDLALILTGGETAVSVIRLLRAEGIEIENEISAGIMEGSLKGGQWDGLKVVTKAGAFGKDDTLKTIVEILGGR